MAILNKVVTKYAKTGAHVTMPGHMIGKEVTIIYEEDVQYFKDLIRKAYYLDRLDINRLNELRMEFDAFKGDFAARVVFIEQVLAASGILRKGNHGNETVKGQTGSGTSVPQGQTGSQSTSYSHKAKQTSSTGPSGDTSSNT